LAVGKEQSTVGPPVPNARLTGRAGYVWAGSRQSTKLNIYNKLSMKKKIVMLFLVLFPVMASLILSCDEKFNFLEVNCSD
jgi:hypothetical protein